MKFRKILQIMIDLMNSRPKLRFLTQILPEFLIIKIFLFKRINLRKYWLHHQFYNPQSFLSEPSLIIRDKERKFPQDHLIIVVAKRASRGLCDLSFWGKNSFLGIRFDCHTRPVTWTCNCPILSDNTSEESLKELN